MKTKLFILAVLLSVDIVLAVSKTETPTIKKEDHVECIDVSTEMKRLNKLANKTEKELKYIAPCTDYKE